MAEEEKKRSGLGAEVSLDSIRGLLKGNKDGGLGGGGYPSKTTMNLYQSDSEGKDPKRAVLIGVLVLALLLAFVKLGFLDPMAQLSAKEAELSDQQAQLAALQASVSDLDELSELYDGYMARYGGGSTDVISVIEMVQARVMPKATVTSITIADNTLTLSLYNVPLDTVGQLARDLEQQDMVDTVNVSTATTERAEGKNTISTLVITLASAESEGEQA